MHCWDTDVDVGSLQGHRDFRLPGGIRTTVKQQCPCIGCYPCLIHSGGKLYADVTCNLKDSEPKAEVYHDAAAYLNPPKIQPELFSFFSFFLFLTKGGCWICFTQTPSLWHISSSRCWLLERRMPSSCIQRCESQSQLDLMMVAGIFAMRTTIVVPHSDAVNFGNGVAFKIDRIFKMHQAHRSFAPS